MDRQWIDNIDGHYRWTLQMDNKDEQYLQMDNINGLYRRTIQLDNIDGQQMDNGWLVQYMAKSGGQSKNVRQTK